MEKNNEHSLCSYSWLSYTQQSNSSLVTRVAAEGGRAAGTIGLAVSPVDRDMLPRFGFSALMQVAQLSQSERTAGWDSYGQKWKTGTGRQYFTDTIGLSSTTVT